jgi:hypothetical protein
MFGSNKGSRSPRDTHGPIVKTGPTKGQNRSRNDNGRWRAKRSDSGSSRKSGCFITTAACECKGLPDDCRELATLRRFRYEHLLSTEEGRALVDQYYEVAPPIAERLSGRPELEDVWATVTQCIEAIECGRFYEATRLYTAMVRSLEQAAAR